MGDFNVALNIEDSYSGSSMMNSAMCGFKDCVKKIEVIDINSYGLHFTWNQKLKGSNRMLKKLDRNTSVTHDFVDNFPGAYALFQPYRISDHSPTVTQKMKNLKKPLRKLLHDQGNLHELVNRLRVKLYVVQKAIDADPSNSLLRDDEAAYIQAFNEAKIDEEHFLCQKEKILNGLIPYGYSQPFLRKDGDVVGMTRGRAVCDFFDNGKLLKEINHTFLALIPNVPTPLRVTDFWPISCCNVLYKCISKILTNRIIEGIKELVSENQSAFVPGRRISDNIILLRELYILSVRDKGPPKVIFKVLISEGRMTRGSFWFNILGVPHISSSLLNRDCKILIEKARNRIGDWKNKSLSFAAAGIEKFAGCTFALLNMKVALVYAALRSHCKWNLELATFMVIKAAKSCTIVVPNLSESARMETVPPILDAIVDWFRPMASKRTFKSIVGKLLFAATAYYIWSERNNRIFKNTRRSPEELKDIIMVGGST
ncbi:hypothetical protein Tco_0843824 [Tanacetum coccineum]